MNQSVSEIYESRINSLLKENQALRNDKQELWNDYQALWNDKQELWIKYQKIFNDYNIIWRDCLNLKKILEAKQSI